MRCPKRNSKKTIELFAGRENILNESLKTSLSQKIRAKTSILWTERKWFWIEEFSAKNPEEKWKTRKKTIENFQNKKLALDAMSRET